MKRKKLKSFEKLQTYEVDDFLGLNQLDNLPTLDQWLQCKEEINPEEKRILNKLQKFLLENVNFLNEEDLKGYFITPILNLIEFYKPKIYKGFYTANFVFYPNETEQIGGKVDYMVAQGKQIPKKPFFFLHEYKKERDTESDPLGQLLVSMLGAQFQNKDNLPVYGLYILGRNWFFVVLEGKNYAVSKAYDATQTDLFEIFQMLKFAKSYIEKQLNLID